MKRMVAWAAGLLLLLLGTAPGSRAEPIVYEDTLLYLAGDVTPSGIEKGYHWLRYGEENWLTAAYTVEDGEVRMGYVNLADQSVPVFPFPYRFAGNYAGGRAVAVTLEGEYRLLDPQGDTLAVLGDVEAFGYDDGFPLPTLHNGYILLGAFAEGTEYPNYRSVTAFTPAGTSVYTYEAPQGQYIYADRPLRAEGGMMALRLTPEPSRDISRAQRGAMEIVSIPLPGSGEDQEAASAPSGFGITLQASLHFRANPSADTALLDRLRRFILVRITDEITAEGHAWFQIETAGEIGYVRGSGVRRLTEAEYEAIGIEPFHAADGQIITSNMTVDEAKLRALGIAADEGATAPRHLYFPYEAEIDVITWEDGATLASRLNRWTGKAQTGDNPYDATLSALVERATTNFGRVPVEDWNMKNLYIRQKNGMGYTAAQGQLEAENLYGFKLTADGVESEMRMRYVGDADMGGIRFSPDNGLPDTLYLVGGDILSLEIEDRDGHPYARLEMDTTEMRLGEGRTFAGASLEGAHPFTIRLTKLVCFRKNGVE